MSSKKKNNIISFPSSPSKLERQVEAILFAASEPLDIETIEKRIQTNTNVKKILEIGSFTGFSALSMAMALPVDGILISLDKNPEFSNKAKYFYDKAKEKRIKQNEKHV